MCTFVRSGRSRIRRIARVTSLLVVAILMGSSFAQGQTESVIYNFVGDFGLIHNGAEPYGEILSGPDGVYYGTAAGGGDEGCTAGGSWFLGCGTVFKLSRMPYGWVANTLLTFHGPNGAVPTGNLVIDAQGNLYGTTVEGGNPICNYGCGTVYELSPPSAPGDRGHRRYCIRSKAGSGRAVLMDGCRVPASIWMPAAICLEQPPQVAHMDAGVTDVGSYSN